MDDLEKRKQKFLALSKPVKQNNDTVPNQNQIGTLDFSGEIKKGIEAGKKFDRNAAKEKRKARKLIQVINEL